MHSLDPKVDPLLKQVFDSPHKLTPMSSDNVRFAYWTPEHGLLFVKACLETERDIVALAMAVREPHSSWSKADINGDLGQRFLAAVEAHVVVHYDSAEHMLMDVSGYDNVETALENTLPYFLGTLMDVPRTGEMWDEMCKYELFFEGFRRYVRKYTVSHPDNVYSQSDVSVSTRNLYALNERGLHQCVDKYVPRIASIVAEVEGFGEGGCLTKSGYKFVFKFGTMWLLFRMLTTMEAEPEECRRYFGIMRALGDSFVKMGDLATAMATPAKKRGTNKTKKRSKKGKRRK